jgi:hypothetical protein
MAMIPMGGVAPSTGNMMQITSTLRGMSDQQLQQYASMHKGDPFVFPLAFQESQTRQQMRAGQAAQMAGQKPPPVVDQDLAQMGGLPEDRGIGALPAQNLERMADGGIAGYADGGPSQPGMFNYAQMAPAVDLHPDSGVTPKSMAAGGVARFADQGFVKGNYSPAFIENFYRTLDLEGGLGYDKRGGTTKYGISKKAYPNLDIGSLTKDDAARIYKKDYWDKINGDRLHEVNPALAATLFDTAVNQGVSKANKYLTTSNGDPTKVLDMRRADYADLAKKDPEVHGKQLTGWNKRLDKLTSALFPAVQAGELPKNEVEDTIQPKAGLTALSQNQNSGYTPSGVEAIGQRLDQAREELKNLKSPGFMQQRKDPNAAVNYQNAQNLVSNLQRTYEEGMGAAHPELTKAAMIGNPANPQGGMRVLPAPARYSQEVAKEVARPDIAAQMGVQTPNYNATTEAEDASFAPTAANKQPPAPDLSSILNPSTTNETPKTGTEAKGGRDWNDILLNLGLGLMAGKSPYAMQNLGEAGLGALRNEQEKRKQDAAERLQEQQGKYYGAYATAIEHGAKEKNLQLEAEKIIQTTLDKNKLLSFDPEARAAAEAKLRQSVYQNLGIMPIMRGGMTQLGKADLDLIAKHLG